jgi:hypothetical protein
MSASSKPPPEDPMDKLRVSPIHAEKTRESGGVRDVVMEICCVLHNFRVRPAPWQPMRDRPHRRTDLVGAISIGSSAPSVQSGVHLLLNSSVRISKATVTLPVMQLKASSIYSVGPAASLNAVPPHISIKALAFCRPAPSCLLSAQDQRSGSGGTVSPASIAWSGAGSGGNTGGMISRSLSQMYWRVRPSAKLRS